MKWNAPESPSWKADASKGGKKASTNLNISKMSHNGIVHHDAHLLYPIPFCAASARTQVHQNGLIFERNRLGWRDAGIAGLEWRIDTLVAVFRLTEWLVLVVNEGSGAHGVLY